MAWAPLTVTAFQTRLSTDEFNALLEECPTPDDKLTEILSQVALEIVSYVNAGRRKRGLAPAVATGLNVPPGASRHAYTIARQLLTDDFPSLAQYNGEDRKAAVDLSSEFLRGYAENNVDSDDAGGNEYLAAVSDGSFRYTGQTRMDFTIIG